MIITFEFFFVMAPFLSNPISFVFFYLKFNSLKLKMFNERELQFREKKKVFLKA